VYLFITCLITCTRVFLVFDMKRTAQDAQLVKAVTAKNARDIEALKRNQPEVKSFDVIAKDGIGTAHLGQSIPNQQDFIPLNLIATGTGSWQRTGRKITLKSIYVTGFFGQLESSEQAYPNYVRVMIVYDKQPKGSLPTQTDLLQASVGANGIPTDASRATDGLNMAYKDRWEIIADERMMLNPYNSTGGTGNVQVCQGNQFEIYRKLKYRESMYGGTTQDIASVSTGVLYLVVIGQRTAYVGLTGVQTIYPINHWYEFTARLRYTDA